MEAAEFETSHFIWKRLPIHPPPEPFESLTSYLIRLAEENGLWSMGGLVGLLRISYGRLTSICTSPDYPAPFALASLSQITGCSEERLEQTTFLPLIQRFGHTRGPHSLQQFLAGSFASGLRYCPHCLAEHSPAYYSLLWRFLALPGCTKHGIQLLDQCGHCQAPIPLFSFPPKLGRCPACQGDLRKGPVHRLSREAQHLSHRRTQDLQILLSPLPGPPEPAQIQMIGKQYMAKRLQLDLLISEAADCSGIDQSVIRDIEQIGEPKSALASLKDYLRYADTLSCSLQEIMDFGPNGELLLTAGLVLNQVEAAIQHLKKQGQPLTKRNIRNLVGMEAAKLWDSPQMVRLLAKHPQRRAHQSQAEKIEQEEEIIKLVEQAIEQIEARGVRVTQQGIGDLVGMTRWVLKDYPGVKARFKQLGADLSLLDLQRAVQEDVTQALEDGSALAYWSIAERIGISRQMLRRDVQVRAMIECAQKEARQRREDDLFSRVKLAIEELVSQGKKVTVSRVSQMVGLDHKGLEGRPHIRELFLILR